MKKVDTRHLSKNGATQNLTLRHFQFDKYFIEIFE